MTSVPGQIVRALLLFFGAVMLLFGVWQQLEPRANYVSSSPEPGATLATAPDGVTISFSNELTAESEVSVASTITLSPSGETIYGDGKRFTARGANRHDSMGRTLHVDLDPGLPRGLYWVRWTAVAVRGRARRSGRLCYAVGMPVPEHVTRDMPGALDERNYRWREHRATLLSGVLLLALGVFLPQFAFRN